jgi:hypothetical protein
VKVVNGVSDKTHHHVIVIGTGFAGLGMRFDSISTE